MTSWAVYSHLYDTLGDMLAYGIFGLLLSMRANDPKYSCPKDMSFNEIHDRNWCALYSTSNDFYHKNNHNAIGYFA